MRKFNRYKIQKHRYYPICAEKADYYVCFVEMMKQPRQRNSSYLFYFFFVNVEADHAMRQHFFQFVFFYEGAEEPECCHFPSVINQRRTYKIHALDIPYAFFVVGKC